MSLLLTYGSIEVELPSPELDDVEQSDFGTSISTAMSGHLYTHKMTDVNNTLKLNFVNVKKATFESLLEFLEDYAGLDIELTDWMGNVWTGKILTEPLDARTEAHDRFTFALEFEGAK